MCFFVFLSVPAENKIPEGQAPRFLEDEGIFVGTRPPAWTFNEAILENRLLKSSGGVSKRELHWRDCVSAKSLTSQSRLLFSMLSELRDNIQRHGKKKNHMQLCWHFIHYFKA